MDKKGPILTLLREVTGKHFKILSTQKYQQHY